MIYLPYEFNNSTTHQMHIILWGSISSYYMADEILDFWGAGSSFDFSLGERLNLATNAMIRYTSLIAFWIAFLNPAYETAYCGISDKFFLIDNSVIRVTSDEKWLVVSVFSIRFSFKWG